MGCWGGESKHKGSCIFHIYDDTLSGPCIMQTLFKDEHWEALGDFSWGNEMENETAPTNGPSRCDLNAVYLHTNTGSLSSNFAFKPLISV